MIHIPRRPISHRSLSERLGIPPLQDGLARHRSLSEHLRTRAERSRLAISATRATVQAVGRNGPRTLGATARSLSRRVTDLRWLLRLCGIAGGLVLLLFLVASSGPPRQVSSGVSVMPPVDSASAKAPAAPATTRGSGHGASRSHPARAHHGTAPRSPAAARSQSKQAAKPAHASSAPRRSPVASAASPSPTATSTSTTSAARSTRSAAPANHRVTAASTTKPVGASLSFSPPEQTACEAADLLCDGRLITSHSAGATRVSLERYLSLHLGALDLRQVIRVLGAPLSVPALRTLVGAGQLSHVIGQQPAPGSCAYYPTQGTNGIAVRLCFNLRYMLSAKSVVTAVSASATS